MRAKCACAFAVGWLVDLAVYECSCSQVIDRYSHAIQRGELSCRQTFPSRDFAFAELQEFCFCVALIDSLSRWISRRGVREFLDDFGRRTRSFRSKSSSPLLLRSNVGCGKFDRAKHFTRIIFVRAPKFGFCSPKLSALTRQQLFNLFNCALLDHVAAQNATMATSVHLSNGMTMPAVGFGTWRCDIDKLDAAVYYAIKIGYRHIDCAGLYKNEHVVGAAIARAIADGLVKREDLFITSKLAPTQMHPDCVFPAINKTIKDLGVGYLDHFITHWPYAIDPMNTIAPAPWSARYGYTPAMYIAVWREMEKAVDAGLVKSLGCSNMTAKKLHVLRSEARIMPVSIQVEMHPCLSQPKLKAYCDKHHIAMTGYCPLGSPGRPAAYRAEGDPEVLTNPVLAGIAARIGKTPAQVALRWAVQRGTVPLPRSTTIERVTENFGIFDWSLSDEDMSALNGIDADGKGNRIMKGDNFQTEGLHWSLVWDEDWEEPTDGAATAAPAS